MHKTPLAERIRPQKLSEIIGQEHLVGNKGVLKIAIKKKLIPSMILWGPPGVGKTTLANLTAKELNRPLYNISAINSGVKDVRRIIEKASSLGLFGNEIPILFIDEIHRFSKNQQDSLLNAVEKGIITLIGATTENPSFEVVPALLSRSQVYILESLSRHELEKLLKRAINDDEVLNKRKITLKETEALVKISNGDARKILNLLELVANLANEKEIIITNKLVSESAQKNIPLYDKNGEQHYNIISAFIKSIRGSDPNAAIYWLARMVEGGEDAKFIARRLLILASEDIGNANPTALVIANNCLQAVAAIGYPEAQITLAQATIYLACSKKSNSAYIAIKKAKEEIKHSGNLPVPLYLRNKNNQLEKEMGYGNGYIYSHEEPNKQQDFLPNNLIGSIFYNPSNNSKENTIREELKKRWKGKYNY